MASLREHRFAETLREANRLKAERSRFRLLLNQPNYTVIRPQIEAAIEALDELVQDLGRDLRTWGPCEGEGSGSFPLGS